ncbi:hypothetical protein L484_006230 [Morus notabilis]|uniref:Uncharacterized protein n=1 Tax=Morus notabilis TaxID=981085 RepID=W9RHI0_9ROSA|nr:hypothetical protein L484_006230 [Morus notabilis]
MQKFGSFHRGKNLEIKIEASKEQKLGKNRNREEKIPKALENKAQPYRAECSKGPEFGATFEWYSKLLVLGKVIKCSSVDLSSKASMESRLGREE